jgi:hypothetical protein
MINKHESCVQGTHVIFENSIRIHGLMLEKGAYKFTKVILINHVKNSKTLNFKCFKTKIFLPKNSKGPLMSLVIAPELCVPVSDH